MKDNNDRTACLAGWENKRVQIKTVATAPPGHKIKPIEMLTYRVPTISDTAETGSIIVRLSTAAGGPKAGVPERSPAWTARRQMRTGARYSMR